MTASLLREYDILWGFGGEEFAVLCPETSICNASTIADRIRKTANELCVTLDPQKINFTVSIGVARSNSNDKTVDDLIKKADNALC